MPELPEVETVRVGLVGAVLGKRVQDVCINRYDLRLPVPDDFRQVFTGQVIDELSRRGKYIIFNLSSGAQAVLHLGMSGRIRIFEAGEDYTPRKHDHILMTLDDSTRFVFEDPRRFGMFYLAQKDYRDEKPFSLMGPEPLEAWSGEDLFNRLSGKRSTIKSALLDQRVVSGLGNIYVCEALYDSFIDPRREAGSVTEKECGLLVKSSRAVLERAIRAGGSTLKDYQKTDGSLGYFQHQFLVYDQEGESCSRDGCCGEIKRVVQSGRSSFFCPVCQG